MSLNKNIKIKNTFRIIFVASICFMAATIILSVLGAHYVDAHQCADEPYSEPAFWIGLTGIVLAMGAFIVGLKLFSLKIKILLAAYPIVYIAITLASYVSISIDNAFCDWQF